MTLIAPMPAIHPAADFFPLIDGKDLQSLADDIKANGQREPCVMLRGKLLDGRNRWRACSLLGIEPAQREFGSRASDGADPIRFVLSVNLHRRHLDASQRAMVAAKARDLFEEEARERRRLGGKAASGDEQARANLREAPNMTTTSRAASLLKVSPRSVSSASVVLASKVPGLAGAVERGDVAVSAAAEVAKGGGGAAIEKVKAALETGDPRKIKQVVKEAAREIRKEDGKPRRAGDAYMSAAGFVRPILPLLAPGSTVIECCAGACDLVGPLREAGHTVITADVDPACAVDHHLDMTEAASWAKLAEPDWVISNLPFSRALAILRHAVERARVGVAVILRLTFLEPTTEGPEARADWLEAHPLTKQIVLPRYSFTGDGKVDSVTCAWMIWERGKAPAIYIPKPDDKGMPGDVRELVEAARGVRVEHGVTVSLPPGATAADAAEALEAAIDQATRPGGQWPRGGGAPGDFGAAFEAAVQRGPIRGPAVAPEAPAEAAPGHDEAIDGETGTDSGNGYSLDAVCICGHTNGQHGGRGDHCLHPCETQAEWEAHPDGCDCEVFEPAEAAGEEAQLALGGEAPEAPAGACTRAGCKAKAGAPCTEPGPGGKKIARMTPHPERLEAARAAAEPKRNAKAKQQLSDEVRDVLSRSRIEGNRLYLPGQLDPKLYKRVDKALQALGGEWKRKERAHVFPNGHEWDVLIKGAVASGVVVDRDKELGFFSTKPAAAAHVVDLAEIKPGMRALEPSAGDGALAAVIADALGWWPESTEPVALVLVEYDVGRADLLRSMRGEQLPEETDVRNADFLKLTIESFDGDGFDRIVMNPPFHAEQEHVRHAFELLNPGGRLVAIMSAGIRFRDRDAAFRRWFAAYGELAGELPPDSFEGTGVRACVVVLTKPAAADEPGEPPPEPGIRTDDKDLIKAVSAACCPDLIGQDKIRKPVEIDGRLWTCTSRGTSYTSGRADVWRLTPLAEWKGATRTHRELVAEYGKGRAAGDHTGQLVTFGKARYVLDGERRIYRWGPEDL